MTVAAGSAIYLALEDCERSGPGSGRGHSAKRTPELQQTVGVSAPSPSRLVGRTAERDEIGVRMSLAGEGVGGLVRLRGEAGIGKTALAEEAAVDARRRGFDTAWSGCWQTAA